MLFTLLSRRLATAAAMALAVFGAASSAHARGDVTFSIGIHVPGARVHAAPVYVPPREAHPRQRPVYVQPRPVFVQPRPVFVQPRPVFVRPRQAFVQPPGVGRHYRNGNDWRRAQWERGRKHGHHGQNRKHGNKNKNKNGRH